MTSFVVSCTSYCSSILIAVYSHTVIGVGDGCVDVVCTDFYKKNIIMIVIIATPEVKLSIDMNVLRAGG